MPCPYMNCVLNTVARFVFLAREVPFPSSASDQYYPANGTDMANRHDQVISDRD